MNEKQQQEILKQLTESIEKLAEQREIIRGAAEIIIENEELHRKLKQCREQAATRQERIEQLDVMINDYAQSAGTPK